ncbi:MAG: glycosyltransferase family 2 protein [Candidatus Omnitrophica bacterium]|nr:glycosyltransferase family 2 protein [Candidatus Omnitrophota bacterium]
MIEHSVIIPLYNERANLEELYTRLSNTIKKVDQPYEIIFVDDGSTDGSFDILKRFNQKDPAVKVIRFSRNFGQEVAFETGFKHTKGRYVIQLDADLQNPPEEIPKLIEKSREGYDIIYGIRKGRKDSIFRKTASKLFHFIMLRFFRIRIPKEVSTFRVIKGELAREIANLPEKSKFFTALASWAGATHSFVEIEHSPRKRGTSKWSLIRLAIHSLDLVIGHTAIPLRMISLFGLLFSLLGFILAIYMVYRKLVTGIAVSGFTSIFTAITIFSGVQLLSLGVIGEYLSRTYAEAQRRPDCIIRETLGL